MIKSVIRYDKIDMVDSANDAKPNGLIFELETPSLPLLRFFDESTEGWNRHKEYLPNAIRITCSFNSQIDKLVDLALKLRKCDEKELCGGTFGRHVVHDSHFATKEIAYWQAMDKDLNHVLNHNSYCNTMF